MSSLGEKVYEQMESIRKLCEAAQQLLHESGYEGLLHDQPALSEGQNEGFSLQRKTLKELRVAAIMDRFTLDSYMPECTLLELVPQGWKQQIDDFHPDLLFIESAWKGKDDLWYRKIANGSKELFELTDYCHSKKIPVIFWNKEDPIYTTTFLPVAHAADFVFTTDIDCIEQYKTALGHDRVYHLHFAAQPTLHNPIEKYDRKRKFCFAGAYYHRYPKRAEVFDAFADVFERREGLDIYDRNYQSALPEHAFPERYAPMILGKLDPSQIDVAYKGYVYGINMNSVNQSQTMFARRVFEMMASNTITVGNYSRGLKNYFGDLTICTDNARVLEDELAHFAGDASTARKYRLAGLRAVLSHHLYEDRLAYIVRKVFHTDILPKLPEVHVIACAASEKAAVRLMGMFQAQSYANCRMTLFADNVQSQSDRIQVLPLAQAKQPVTKMVQTGAWVAAFSPTDWYGENYLLDMMLTLRYSSFKGMGKVAHFTAKDDHTVVSGHLEKAYRPTEQLSSTCAVFAKELCESFTAQALCSGEWIHHPELFAVDEFNYCQDFQGDCCDSAKDLTISDQGIALTDIERATEKIQMTMLEEQEDVLRIGGEKLAQIPLPKDHTLTLSVSNEGTELISTLEEGKHVYVYLKERIAVQQYLREGKLPILFQGVGSLDLICVVIPYDQAGAKLSPLYPKLNRGENLELPSQAVSIQLGFRPKGPGKMVLQGILVGNNQAPNRLATFLSRSDTLVLTNHYPSYSDLYRNMFVHRRMLAYKEEGHVFDIFRLHLYAQNGYREFEGINVLEGHAQELDSVLSNGRIQTVCVHFMDQGMWEVLKHHLNHVHLIIWLHGADVRPWTRRAFDFVTPEEIEQAKIASDQRMKLWREIFVESEKKNIHFVFVSRKFQEEVMHDYEITLNSKSYSIIHNCIDTDLYSFEPKKEQQRKKILSIKTYASRSYATDLTSKAILALANRPEFKDMDIHLYGDGIFFEKDTACLKKFSNVHLHRQFLTQKEIAQLHKTFGVFLATTRLDSQGVSRDEAMSSGMVVIANNISSVPEFVDESCGVLVPPENPEAIAEAICHIYNDPSLFIRLSENAAKRVRSQTSRPYTIDKELQLILKQ